MGRYVNSFGRVTRQSYEGRRESGADCGFVGFGRRRSNGRPPAWQSRFVGVVFRLCDPVHRNEVGITEWVATRAENHGSVNDRHATFVWSSSGQRPKGFLGQFINKTQASIRGPGPYGSVIFMNKPNAPKNDQVSIKARNQEISAFCSSDLNGCRVTIRLNFGEVWFGAFLLQHHTFGLYEAPDFLGGGIAISESGDSANRSRLTGRSRNYQRVKFGSLQRQEDRVLLPSRPRVSCDILPLNPRRRALRNLL